MLEEPDNLVAGDEIEASATMTPYNFVALQALPTLIRASACPAVYP